jgi:hypothetical protein
MKPNKPNLNYFWIVSIFCLLISLGHPAEAKKEKKSTSDSKGYFDSKLLETTPVPGKKGATKKIKKAHHKTKQKNTQTNSDQNSNGPQEDVTSQKDVSDQADNSGKPQKK